MILGIISIVIGAIIFISTLISDISNVNQQIVQYLGFIWASMFVIGGFILITIHKCLNKNQEKTAPPTVAKNIEEKKELTLSEIRGKVISELI